MLKKKATGNLTLLKAIEGAAAFLLMLALTSVFTAYSKNNKYQSVKVECYNANVSAIEQIKKLFYETGDIRAVNDFSFSAGTLRTNVKECVEINPGSGIPVVNADGVQIYDGTLLPYNSDLTSANNPIYFVTVYTTHEGREIKGTALSVYLMPRNVGNSP